MRILSVDTSSKVATAALIADGTIALELAGDTDRKHAETLLPLLERLLTETGLTLEEVDLFAVNVGPGSFTGVRIGVSVINAMAYALSKKIVPVDALRALYQHRIHDPGRFLAMLDAANGNAYGALYEHGRTLVKPAAVEGTAFLKQYGADATVIGDVFCQPPLYPNAGMVGLAALEMTDKAAEAAMPVYLRPSQAERLYQAKMEGEHLG